MIKNKVLLLVAAGIFAAELSASNAQFEVRELNYSDAREIEELCKFFENEYVPVLMGEVL